MATAEAHGVEHFVAATFPVLTGVGDFDVSYNAALTSLSFPELTNVDGNFLVSTNVMLPTCQAQAVLDQLVGVGMTTEITANNDAGTCP